VARPSVPRSSSSNQARTSNPPLVALLPHPRTVLFETMKRQVELWLQLLQTADPGQLFSESQRDLLLDAFVKWKSGSQFKPLDRKLRNARFYEELRRRMRPSPN
jgi:hypothetical protein